MGWGKLWMVVLANVFIGFIVWFEKMEEGVAEG